MNITGIIVEYNPLHNGHNYHLSKSREITKNEYTIAIMSGHFLQRGEPALFNKWFRTKMALRAGIDIVIELPTIYSCQSAELFSYGAVQLLEKLGIINSLVFGSETNNIEDLKIISNILANEPDLYQKLLKSELNKGVSFPSARTKALEKFCFNYNNNHSHTDIKSILQYPNNILGIEYLKWLKRFKSKIIPETILRVGSGYHDKELNTDFSSATAIRNQIFSIDNNYNKLIGLMPSSSFSIIKEAIDTNFLPARFDDMSKSILSILLRYNTKDLKKFLDINEGLESRIFNQLNTNSIEELIGLVKTKRYTYTRIQRILCHVLLNITSEDINLFKENGGVQYIRVLGFSEKGKNILPKLKKHSSLPIITNLSKSYKSLNPIQRKMMDFDILATNIYHIHFTKMLTYNKNMDFTCSPIIIEK
jgi:predicted nucleotidyltransferase